MCHVPGVMSCVKCHVSHVICHMSYVTCFFLHLHIFFLQSCEASLECFINGAYPFKFLDLLNIYCQTTKKKLFHKLNLFFLKSNLTTNLMMLLNLETFLGFVLEFKINPIYLHEHMVSYMCFNMGHTLE